MANKERILALDIGASSVKLAEFGLLKNDQLELRRYGVAQLGLDPHHEEDRFRYIVSAIKELLAEQGVKPGPVNLTVSGQSVFSRFVKLPPVDSDKVFQIVQYEAQQNVPFPIEEVVWDYQLVGSSDGEIDVMLVAIKEEILLEITNAVEEAGLQPELVDVGPLALYNAVRHNYADLEGCTLLIDIGARSTNLIFIEDKKLFTRSVPVGGNAITQAIAKDFDISFTDAEELKQTHGYVSFGAGQESGDSDEADRASKSVRSIMTKLHSEIHRSINFYRSQQAGSQPGLVLLCGGASVLPYTDSFLKEKLKIDVEYLNPFEQVTVANTIDEESISREAQMLGETVGVALRDAGDCPIEINLIPPEIAQAKAFKKKQMILGVAAILLALSTLIWGAYFWKMSSLASQQYSEVEQTVNELNKTDRALAAVYGAYQKEMDSFEELKGLLERRGQWSRVIDEIQSQLPAGMWLTQVKVKADEGANAQGATKSFFSNPQSDKANQANIDLGAYSTVTISGMGYLDKVKSETVIVFAEKLKQSTSFDPERTAITRQPVPDENSYLREFTIDLGLVKPLKP